MEFTIVSVDVILSFRLLAVQHDDPAYVWELDVPTIFDVADVLVELRFIDEEVASKLTTTSPTPTPHTGVGSLRLSSRARLDERLYPEEESLDLNLHHAYMLVVQGQTTQEELVEAGFCFKPRARIQ